MNGFRQDGRGSVTVIFGLAATTLIGLVGGAIDYARVIAARGQIQMAADTGVMAGGNALKLVVSNLDAIVGVTTQTIQTEAKASADNPVTIQVSVAADKTSVTAKVEKAVPLTFGPFIGLASMTVAATAKASVVGKMRLCMLALDPAAPGAFTLEKSAQVTAYDCALYSNSANGSGMVGRDNALARAQIICSAGGFRDDRANFTPNPQTGCPVIQDPLRDRAAPSIGACTPSLLPLNLLNPLLGGTRITGNRVLEPGTYCGGLMIMGHAQVTLKPGIYVIKDGPLLVTNTASLTGTDVGFYFTGSNSGLLFNKGTTISLAAPTTGPMAGLLMSEDRSQGSLLDPAMLLNALLPISPVSLTPPPLGLVAPMRIYRIISDNARTMLGTIYLPTGRLVIDATRPVADQSAYTVVVAKQINLYEGPNLYLNANYSGTSVPVPKGVGPLSGRLLLSQ
ncbi:TadE/TadG family type IV pilus assembly protein [Methylobacterium sp. Leaf118]|uniref:TadE/TadG family type IV pilus assembly protein n=1 Tax=Methylobacterium sp. Leaf118 TaxID=2876562 RepID=UPI001E3F2DE7|nr:pilus assembly protein TadG-related protein [Methylobacterium sp. Leaf118]